MKKIFLILIITSAITFGQFKGDENKPIDIRSGILSEDPLGSLFSFINPNDFAMNHSFGLSYSSFGNNGVALGVYKNNISYKFSDKFDFELVTSIVNSPYNSLGDSFSNAINGVYIDRARVNYRPSEDFNLSIQFSNSPFNYYNSNRNYGFSPYSSFWYDE